MPAPGPHITIGMPVYNGERYLPAAIDSLLAQTFRDFELIISDNASTDRTECICQSYAARDSRIRYMRQESNIGVTRNFNLLVDRATTPFFKWASADDVVAPDLLERCMEVIKRDPTIVLVHSRARFIDADGKPLHRDDSGLCLMDERASDRLRRLWLTLGFCNAQYGVMRTEVLRQTKLFGLFLGSDICFLAELSLRGKFFEINEHLLFRRLHDQAASNLSAERLLEFYGIDRHDLVLYHWRHLYENTKAILRVQIGTAERLRALILIPQRMVGIRNALWRELGFMLCHVTGRPYRHHLLGPVGRFSHPRSGAQE